MFYCVCCRLYSHLLSLNSAHHNCLPQEPECPARHEGAAGQGCAVTCVPLALPCRNLHPDRGRSCHDVRGIPGMLRCYSGVSVSSGNGKKHTALEVTWHPDFPAGWHVAVLPLLGSFPTSGAGRMCEHGGGNLCKEQGSGVWLRVTLPSLWSSG